MFKVITRLSFAVLCSSETQLIFNPLSRCLSLCLTLFLFVSLSLSLSLTLSLPLTLSHSLSLCLTLSLSLSHSHSHSHSVSVSFPCTSRQFKSRHPDKEGEETTPWDCGVYRECAATHLQPQRSGLTPTSLKPSRRPLGPKYHLSACPPYYLTGGAGRHPQQHRPALQHHPQQAGAARQAVRPQRLHRAGERSPRAAATPCSLPVYRL